MKPFVSALCMLVVWALCTQIASVPTDITTYSVIAGGVVGYIVG